MTDQKTQSHAFARSRSNSGLGDAPLCTCCKKPMRFVAQGYSDELASVVNLYHCDDPCWTQKRVRVATPNVD